MKYDSGVSRRSTTRDERRWQTMARRREGKCEQRHVPHVDDSDTRVIAAYQAANPLITTSLCCLAHCK